MAADPLPISTTPTYAGEAAAAVEAIASGPPGGERIFDELEIAFGRAEKKRSLRLRILRVYARMDSPRALELLVKKLRFPDKVVRQVVLEALVYQGYEAEGSTAGVVREAIRELAHDTIWHLATQRDLGHDDTFEPVLVQIENEIRSFRSQLFQLLSLLYDPQTLRLVRENLEDDSEEKRVYAIEILEMLVDEDLAPLVLPLVEGLPAAQALKRLGGKHSGERLTPMERLIAIVHRSRARVRTRTQAMALEALARSASDGEVPSDVLAHFFHADALLQEIAARAIWRLDAKRFEEMHGWLPLPDREHLDRVLGKLKQRGEENWPLRSVLGRLEILESHPGPRALPWHLRRELIARCEERFLPQGKWWPPETEHGSTMSIVMEGGFVPGEVEGSEDSGLHVFGPPIAASADGVGHAAALLEQPSAARVDERPSPVPGDDS